MTSSSPAASTAEGETERTWKLIHRHAHDLRNRLNSMEMELMLLGELTNDPRTHEVIPRLKAQLAAAEALVKSLVIKFAEPEPVVVAAIDLVNLWQMQVKKLLGPGREIQWDFIPQVASVRIDARAVVSALTDLTLAAWARSGGRCLQATLEVANDEVKVCLREPGQASALSQDLLRELDRMVLANGGRLEHAGTPSELAEWGTSLSFPLLSSFPNDDRSACREATRGPTNA